MSSLKQHCSADLFSEEFNLSSGTFPKIIQASEAKSRTTQRQTGLISQDLPSSVRRSKFVSSSTFFPYLSVVKTPQLFLSQLPSLGQYNCIKQLCCASGKFILTSCSSYIHQIAQIHSRLEGAVASLSPSNFLLPYKQSPKLNLLSSWQRHPPKVMITTKNSRSRKPTPTVS